MTSLAQVFARTAKGDLEVTGKARLSAGLRTVLNLIDGESSVAELSARVGLSRSVLEATLEMLLEDGLVKAVSLKVQLTSSSDVTPNPDRQVVSESKSRNKPSRSTQNLSPATDFLGSMMRDVQQDLAKGKGNSPVAPSRTQPPVSSVTPNRVPVPSNAGVGKAKSTETAQAKIVDAEAREQARRVADSAMEKTALEAEVRAAEEAKRRLHADARLKEAQTQQRALETDARAQAAAVAAKLTAGAEARAQQEAARRKAKIDAGVQEDELKRLAFEAEARAQEAARLQVEAEARAQAAAAERLKMEIEARAREEAARLQVEAEARAREDELQRLASEAEACAQAAAAERLKMETEARAREEAARLQVEAEAKAREDELQRLASEAEARAQAVAEEERLKVEAEARSREAEALLRAETEFQARLQAEAEAKLNEAELKRLAMEAKARADATEAEAKLNAETEARAREVEARLKAEAEAEYQARIKAEFESAAREVELRRLADEEKDRALVAAAETEAIARQEVSRRRAEEETQLNAAANARAEVEIQERLNAEVDARSGAEAELKAREQAQRDTAEARIEHAIAAKNRGASMANASGFDTFGIPNFSMPAREFDAPSTSHAAYSPEALYESPLDDSIELPDAMEQAPYPDRDIEDSRVLMRGVETENEQAKGFSPAQRAAKAPGWSSKLTRLTKVRTHRRGAGVPWGKIVGLPLLLLAVAAIGGLRLFPQAALKEEAERVFMQSLGEPVSIAAATIELFPSPLVRLEGVKIGEPAVILIGEIKATPDLSSWLNGTKAFRAAELGAVSFAPHPYENIYQRLLAARTNLKLPVRRIVIPAMGVPRNGLGLKTVTAELELNPEGGLRKVVFNSKEGQLTMAIEPQDGHFQLTLSAQAWRFPGADFDMQSVNAAGKLTTSEFIIEDLNGRANGGRFDGKGTIRWSNRWKLSGTFKIDAIDVDRFPAIPVVSQGKLSVNGKYDAEADASENLLSRMILAGKFSVQDGKLSGIDITRTLHESPQEIFGGKTPFKTIDGVFQSSAKGYELRNMRLVAGPLSASGQASFSTAKELNGRLAASVTINQRKMQETLRLSGTAAGPRIRVD